MASFPLDDHVFEAVDAILDRQLAAFDAQPVPLVAQLTLALAGQRE